MFHLRVTPVRKEGFAIDDYLPAKPAWFAAPQWLFSGDLPENNQKKRFYQEDLHREQIHENHRTSV